MACHRSQFGPEIVDRLVPELGRLWNGKIAFIPASLSMSGDDLFR
jgi:hypothetical protein